MAVLQAPSDIYNEIQPGQIPVTPNLPEDDDALKLVVKDLNLAEYYLLAKGMTVEWDKDDRLFLFRMPQAFWEGSSVPRSSLGMPLIMEHIESIMPQVMNALFNDPNDYFDVEPMPKTKMPAARGVKHILNFQLDEMGFKEETRQFIKEALTYGTDYAKLKWNEYTRQEPKWKREGAPEVQSSDAGPVTIPTKKSRKLKAELEDVTVRMPGIEKVHVRHLVVDPSLRGPDIRKARYVIHRTYPTLVDLEELRGKTGYDLLPPKEKLLQLFFPPKEMPERSLLEGRSTTSVLNTGVSSLDINMEFKAMPRWQMPSNDPNLQPLECLEYWTNDKCIVVLNRKLTIKNDRNPFGFLPFLSINYIDVPDSFYGVGIAKLLGGEQRLQQGVINSRLDDLALRLSGTFIRKRGSNTPTQQVRLRPGGIIDSDDEKGIQMIQYPPALQDAFEEVAQSDMRAQRRTGANEMVTQGTMPSAGQVGRTASGVQTLSAGVGARLGYFVDQIATLYFIPALEAFHKMNCMWLTEDDIDSILEDKMKDEYNGACEEIKNARVKFRMLAGAKMRSRQQLAQSLPMMTQFLMSPDIQGALSDQGLKLDLVEMVQLWFDVTETPGRQSLIQKLTPEDKARIAAKNEAMIQSNLESQKNAHALQQIEAKGQAQAGTHVIKALADHLSPEQMAAAGQGDQSAQPDSGNGGTQ